MPPVAVAAVGGGLSALAGGYAAGLAGTALLGSVLASAAISAAMAGMQMAFAPKPTEMPPNTAIRQPIPSGKLPYGRCRVGGSLSLFHRGDAPNWNRTLQVCMVIACGQIGGVNEIWDGDKLLWSVTGGIEPDYQDKVHDIVIRTGGDDQTAITKLHSDVMNSELDENFRMRGWAYIWLNLADPAKKWGGQLPDLWAEIDGLKVYDPRDGQRKSVGNWGLVMADYLTRNRGGAGFEWADLDEDEVIAAANLCDEQVPKLGGGTHERYRVDGEIDTSSIPQEVIEELVVYGAGQVIDANGLIKIRAGAYEASVMSISDGDYRGEEPLEISGSVNFEDVIDGVRGIYSDPDALYEQTDFPAVLFDDYTGNVANANLDDVPLPRCTDGARAQRLAILQGRQARRMTKIAASVAVSFLAMEAGDNVSMAHAATGLNGVYEAQSVVLHMSPKGCWVEASFLEDDPSFWTFSEDTATVPPSSPRTNLPTTKTVQPPQNVRWSPTVKRLPDGSTIPAILVEWNESPDYWVEEYVVRWTRQNGTVGEKRVKGLSYEILGEDSNVTITVTAVNGLGRESTPSSGGTAGTPVDTIAPSAPVLAQISAFGNFESVGLFWTNPPEKDFRAMRIREGSTSSFAASTLIDSVAGTPGAAGMTTRPGLAGGQKRYYWLAADDRSNNVSAWVGPVEATATKINTNQLAFTTLPQSFFSELQVTLQMLEDGLIPGTKLAAQSVTAREVLAGSLGVSRLVVSDFENKVPDAGFNDPAAWSGLTPEFQLVDSSDFESAARIAQHSGGTGYAPDGFAGNILSTKWKVRPGERLFASILTRAWASATGSMSAYIRWLDKAGNLLPSTGVTESTIMTMVLDGTHPSDEQTHDIIATAPAGAAFAQLRLRRGADSGGNAEGYAMWYSPFVVRATGGEMVVNGTLTGDKIAANTITADNLAVNSITANKIVAGEITTSKLIDLAITHDKLDYGAAHVAFSETDSSLREIFNGQTHIVVDFNVPNAGLLTYKLQINFQGLTLPLRMRMRSDGSSLDTWALDSVNGTTGGTNAVWDGQRLFVSDGLVPVSGNVTIDFILDQINEAVNITFSRFRAVVQQKT